MGYIKDRLKNLERDVKFLLYTKNLEERVDTLEGKLNAICKLLDIEVSSTDGFIARKIISN